MRPLKRIIIKMLVMINAFIPVERAIAQQYIEQGQKPAAAIERVIKDTEELKNAIEHLEKGIIHKTIDMEALEIIWEGIHQLRVGIQENYQLRSGGPHAKFMKEEAVMLDEFEKLMKIVYEIEKLQLSAERNALRAGKSLDYGELMTAISETKNIAKAIRAFKYYGKDNPHIQQIEREWMNYLKKQCVEDIKLIYNATYELLLELKKEYEKNPNSKKVNKLKSRLYQIIPYFNNSLPTYFRDDEIINITKIIFKINYFMEERRYEDLMEEIDRLKRL